jgi:putrescine aminotransferase
VNSDCNRAAGEAAIEESVLAVVKRHLSPGLALGYKLIGRGAFECEAHGATVVLSDGREVLDFGAYGAVMLGHRHPAVLAAVRAQLDTLTTSTRALANPVVAGFVSDLLATFSDRYERAWLGSDGADVVEVAVKLARRASGRLRVLAVERSFHGKTLGALPLTANRAFHTGLEPLLGYASHIAADDPAAVARETGKGDVAAVIFEPVQGEGGVHVLAHDVLGRWAADARAAGAFVISDEIQCGLRRCGPISLAVDYGVEPDAVLLGKALGGGVMPLAALVATERLHRPLARDPTWHSSTFGGHPLACAAGRAALAVVEDPATRARMDEIARYCETALGALGERHRDVVADVRGKGMLWGIELRNAGLAGTVLVELAERDVLVSPCLSAPRTIRIVPPLVATDEQLRQAWDALSGALSEAGSVAAAERVDA